MCASVPSERRVHLFFLGDSKMYPPGTIANSQRTLTKINKNDAIAKDRILVEQVILYSI